jgi:membrane protein implicated in regulation of membrane protease activity
MNDRTLGMIVATAIAAPVVVICCGGGLALAGSALAGLGGWLWGANLPLSLLMAVAAGALVLALRQRFRGGSDTDRGEDPEAHRG